MNTGRHEFELIAWIRQQTRAHDRIPLGIGDDTAALAFPQPANCLVTVDMLMEGVHFTMPPATPRQIGHKALAVNLSDIAAMAGHPLAAVISLALPRGIPAKFAEELYAGIGELADQFGVAIAGGDTNSWQGPLVISITALGETTDRGAVTRSGARPGDAIFVTGDLGGSLAGKHLDFTPRINEALKLHGTVDLHAMLDVSDGLAADLQHIVEESGVGVILDESAIPISSAARTAVGQDGRSAWEHALSDGEDFELLFTVSDEDAARLLANSPLEIPLSRIGTVVDGNEMQLRTAAGEVIPLPVSGWKHLL
ncbi:thiamine-phosphate kinase [Symmachiella dynata]|uniref:thiamine-phosphate kinase n=1 Tax=Symmachiella dynata TaxID=2527995 RepID=UPI0030EB9BC5